MSRAKTAEPIEMLFGLRTRVGPGKVGVQIPHGKGNFEGMKGRPIVKYVKSLCGHLCKKG